MVWDGCQTRPLPRRKEDRAMSLTEAIEQRNWELAALLLLLGLSRVLARLPQGTAEDLLAELEGEDD